MKKKIIITSNSCWNIFNFRKGLIKELLKSNYEIIVVAPYDECADIIKNLGCSYFPIVIDRKGINPFQNIKIYFQYLKIFKLINPQIILTFTIKPNIFSSIAANYLKIPIINNITGLGSTFINKGVIYQITKFLYKISIKYSSKVFFQNYDDLKLFVNLKLVDKYRAERIPGSGINLNSFKSYQNDKNLETKNFNFLLISRILIDKGIREYIEAAKIILRNNSNISFNLIGKLDLENPSKISKSDFDKLIKSGPINYLGYFNDVKTFINESDCVVLPSYREGLPNVLLEAAALSKPIIATDVAGCRDIVEDGINGYLCIPKNSNDLADKMIKLANHSKDKLIQMGQISKAKIEKEFDENIVIDKYLKTIDSILIS